MLKGHLNLAPKKVQLGRQLSKEHDDRKEREERRRTRKEKKRHFPFSVVLVPKVKFGCFKLSVVVVNQNIVGRG